MVTELESMERELLKALLRHEVQVVEMQARLARLGVELDGALAEVLDVKEQKEES